MSCAPQDLSEVTGLITSNATYRLEIANSAAERQKGLSCRASMTEDAGMLFVFEDPGVYRFWMKDTFIPLDMIWLDEDKRIVYIEPDVQPDSFPTHFGPQESSLYVIELNAGQAALAGIEVGQQLNFTL